MTYDLYYYAQSEPCAGTAASAELAARDKRSGSSGFGDWYLLRYHTGAGGIRHCFASYDIHMHCLRRSYRKLQQQQRDHVRTADFGRGLRAAAKIEALFRAVMLLRLFLRRLHFQRGSFGQVSIVAIIVALVQERQGRCKLRCFFPTRLRLQRHEGGRYNSLYSLN